ncbi:unnamed protein product, partial [Musa hybrid cultivar]
MVLYSCEEPKEEEERGGSSRQFDVPCPGFRGRWSLNSHEVASVSYEPKLPVVCNASGRKKRSKKCRVGWVREEGREDA